MFKFDSLADDIKLYNVGDELFDEKSKPNRFNIINDLNIFPTAGNPCFINDYK